MIKKAAMLAFAGVVVALPAASFAGLTGSTMGDQYYAYGGAYNSQTNFVVGAGVEDTFLSYFDIDVDDTSITFDYLPGSSSTWSSSSLSLAPTIYNGIAIRMVSGPAFTNVTVNGATNMAGFSASNISWTGSEIQIDWQNLSFDGDTIVKLDVEAVPEPATAAALALGGLGLMARRRRK
ncbi:MAG: PEP-CTERM sorting domain-containing protein [Armatimonadetes bacterium]|nr:PEP-CTERM sorting domain-containing protein [Armatimonadota bacterium]